MKMNERRNEIYLALVEFADKPTEKLRPVVIVSRNSYNKKHPDVIVCSFTTNSSGDCFIPLEPKYLAEGEFFEESGIRYDGIQRFSKSRLRRKIGKITDEFHDKISAKIMELVS
jgi:mRNA-degrading endonuclease toxin of MazEF toxin-antitoxin module